MSDPYVDPHAYNPEKRTNTVGFAEGYWRYREGKNYNEIPNTPDHLAGWCYGLTEGKRKETKPLWESKSFYDGLALIIISIWGGANKELIINNPEMVSVIGAAFGLTFVFLRRITKAAIK